MILLTDLIDPHKYQLDSARTIKGNFNDKQALIALSLEESGDIILVEAS